MQTATSISIYTYVALINETVFMFGIYHPFVHLFSGKDFFYRDDDGGSVGLLCTDYFRLSAI